MEFDPKAVPQLDALPDSAVPAFAELVTLLSVSPANGDLDNRERPQGNMRCVAFGPGGQGLVVSFFLEDQRRTVVLRIYWSD